MPIINLFAAWIMIGTLAFGIRGRTEQEPKNQPSGGTIEHQAGRSELEFPRTRDAFSGVLSAARLPGGIATITNGEDEPVKHSNVPVNGALREALDVIIRADPQYEWFDDDGVVNILPLSGEPALLTTRIKEFYVEDLSVDSALNRLLQLPEIRKKWEELGLSSGIDFLGLRSPRPRKITMQCQDVTLREALNAIARTHGRAVWSYSEWHCHGRREVRINFVVR
jgi:hypothetical protein